MTTSLETVAKFMATVIWADGVYDEAEKITVEEISEALELDTAKFKAAVEKELKAVKTMDEKAATRYLEDAAEEVADEEIGEIFECAMQLVLADNKLAYNEITDLLIMADALGLEHEYAVLMLADMVKEEPELEISFEE